MKKTKYKRQLSSSTSRPTEASIFDDELEAEIREILQIGRTHMAGISVRRGLNETWTEHKTRTIVMFDEPDRQQCKITSDGGDIFHIASITKVLIAAAVVIAIETKAKENASDNPYHNFKDIQQEPVTKLYNQRREVKMGALPGNPTMYNLMVHCEGLPSSNHRLLAPDGTPIMSLAELRDEVLRPITQDALRNDGKKSMSGYSNINYSTIAMTIEVLWGRTLDTFMNETLFEPLGMKSTSIGYPIDQAIENSGWLVDSEGTPHKISRPNYRPDGAEAGALGAYSTVHDLDIFYKFIIDSLNDQEVLPGFDCVMAAKMLKMEFRATDSLTYTAFGLYTDLGSSRIGDMSSNRLQFPDEHFSTYPVLKRKPIEDKISTFYMAGSAIGCSCATAFHPSEKTFAIVVLTDTSGPVDTADHILRLILRKIVWLWAPDRMCKNLQWPESVKDMVKSSMTASMHKWQQIEIENSNYTNQAPMIKRVLLGVYKGDGFSQRLEIFKKNDGKTYVIIRGSSTSSTTSCFEIVWVDNFLVKICVPPHLSIDCLGQGDWSNLLFRVTGQERIVRELIRETALGEDRFLRLP